MGLLAIGVLPVLSCGGASLPRTPAYSAEAIALARAAPDSAAPAVASDCADREACAAACQRGDPDACARHADYLFPSAPADAETAWLSACRSRSAHGCERLMEVASRHDRVLAAGYAEHACAYGDGETCEYLGTLCLARGLTPARDEDRTALLRQSVDAMERACDLDRWLGCAWAVIAKRTLEPGVTQDTLRPLGQRAFALADARCNEAEADACAYLADQFERAGQAAEAQSYWAKGCRALLSVVDPEKRAGHMKSPVCERAAALGVAPPDMRAIAPATTLPGPREISREETEAHRIAGETRISPPDSIKLAIKHSSGGAPISRITMGVRLCISSLGGVRDLTLRKTSGSDLYDRLILETMRQWRYRPFEIDGKPTEACTTVTFIYDQRN